MLNGGVNFWFVRLVVFKTTKNKAIQVLRDFLFHGETESSLFL